MHNRLRYATAAGSLYRSEGQGVAERRVCVSGNERGWARAQREGTGEQCVRYQRRLVSNT